MYCRTSLEDNITAGGGETDAVPMRLRQVQHNNCIKLCMAIQGVRATDMCGQATFISADFADMAPRCVNIFNCSKLM